MNFAENWLVSQSFYGETPWNRSKKQAKWIRSRVTRIEKREEKKTERIENHRARQIAKTGRSVKFTVVHRVAFTFIVRKIVLLTRVKLRVKRTITTSEEKKKKLERTFIHIPVCTTDTWGQSRRLFNEEGRRSFRWLFGTSARRNSLHFLSYKRTLSANENQHHPKYTRNDHF